jgi:OmpA-OmpF porin, OOP family
MTASYAQQSKKELTQKEFDRIKHKQWEIGLLAGSSVYTGDVHCEKFFLKAVNPGGGLYARYYFNDNISSRLNFQYAKITGNDSNYGSDHTGRNFNFTSGIFDANVTLEWEPFGHRRYRGTALDFHRILSPYVNLGVGGLYSKPKVNFNEANTNANAANIALDQLNKNYFHLVVPFGGGIRYDLTNRITLGAEGDFRMTFNDYVDGVSYAGNSKRNDWYYTANLLLGYRFDYKRDADGDGVLDEVDACPMLPGLASTKGCPDMDGDGISDKVDKCPREKGVSYLDGCPDRDGDGVADAFDNCPDVAGESRYAGCPDTDGDGIIDSNDECPKTKGIAKFNGCPDTDSDGISDKYDSCPTEKGSIEDNGCPAKDTDGDGVPDKTDKCPEIKGTIENGGCAAIAPYNNTGTIDGSMSTSSSSSSMSSGSGSSSSSMSSGSSSSSTSGEIISSSITTDYSSAVNNTGYETVISQPTTGISTYSEAVKTESSVIFNEALYGIQFETGSAVLTSGSYTILNKVNRFMQKNTSYSFEIGGHTDNQGSSVSNQRLSEARAQAVYKYLTSQGIRGSRLTYKGYGDTNPIESNDNAQGRAKNRRVVFTSF